MKAKLNYYNFYNLLKLLQFVLLKYKFHLKPDKQKIRDKIKVVFKLMEEDIKIFNEIQSLKKLDTALVLIYLTY